MKNKRVYSICQLFDVQKEIPTIYIELRYATKNNFTGHVIYNDTTCYLRRETIDRLKLVQAELESKGLFLKIWDGYRSLEAQKKLWEVVSDPLYVSDPSNGGRHTRGTAVDVTLVDINNKELVMPTDFDDFSEKAHSGYEGLAKEVLKNRNLLQRLMRKNGFESLPTEWWHFDLVGWQEYDVIEKL